jgi:hypothetical protein
MPPGRPDLGMLRDLERMALDFARELRAAAWHTEAVGTDAVTGLRAILEDTLTRIKDEIFGGTAARPGEAGQDDRGADDHGGADGSGA